MMQWTLLLAALVQALLVPGTGFADPAGTSAAPARASCPADSVVSRFFSLLNSGQADEARGLFLIRGDDQEGIVEDFVTEGLAVLARWRINIRVVETFATGQVAVCAVEQTSPELPEVLEIEPAYLVLDAGTWWLLPMQQDYRSKFNHLSPEELASFDLLRESFLDFKRGQFH